MPRTAITDTRATIALEALGRLPAGDASAQRVVEEIARLVVDVIGVDAHFVGATDPITGQCLGAAVHDIPEAACPAYWEHELLVPDFNAFADIAPSEPVGDLRIATGGRLSRSARYRAVSVAAGLEDELRAKLVAGGRSWGILQLNRRVGRPPFSDADRAFLQDLSPVAGAALRAALLADPVPEVEPGPGVVIVDDGGAILSATAEADAWLTELTPRWRDRSTTVGVHAELLLLPLSQPTESEGRSRRIRLRTLGGRWLVAHASALAGSGQTAIVIEPAKPSEVAPLTVEAYQLTDREAQVTRLVARGASTEEIAAELFLSRHTVRDHLKAVFEKVGVSSRGELTSKLFAERHQGPRIEAFAVAPRRRPRDHADCRPGRRRLAGQA